MAEKNNKKKSTHPKKKRYLGKKTYKNLTLFYLVRSSLASLASGRQHRSEEPILNSPPQLPANRYSQQEQE
jgi:hypothetical protein